MILFAYHALMIKEIEAKLASFGLSLLSLTFLLRELDVEKFDIPFFYYSGVVVLEEIYF